MFTRLRTTWLAGAGAAFLVMALSGAVMGASLLTTAAGPTSEEEFDPIAEIDTTRTFEDADGDGVDDDCDSEVIPDPDAEAVAFAAVDVDGDGVVSVDEAAQSPWTGGANCNHGGYVSPVAGGSDDADEADEADEALPVEATECEEVAAPTFDPAVLGVPGGFGQYVSLVAESDAVGGKNCNHGGAVSAAVKTAKDAATLLRQAAQAERVSERTAATAERTEQRTAARAERDATKAERAASKASESKATAAQSQGKGRAGGG
ncbi:MAG: hypothetical protein WEG56_04110 [Chloroflexota bacterium]